MNKRIRLISSSLFSACLVLHSACTASIAGPVTLESTNSASPYLDADVKLKTIGPLHVSDGLVRISHNQINVFSDESDAKAEAELVGDIIYPHLASDQSGPTITGIALFTRGYSVTALSSAQAEETVQSTNGFDYVGSIIAVESGQLQIRTHNGIQTVPLQSISGITSTRAYKFSIAVPPDSLGKGTSLTTNSSRISFSPTYVFDPSAHPQSNQTKTLQGQLTEKHVGKRLFWTAASIAGVCACFAIPIIIGAVTPHQLADTRRAIRSDKINRRAAKTTTKTSDKSH